MKEDSEHKGERAISLVLRYGALIATLFMAAGVTLALFRKPPAPSAAYHSIRPGVLFHNLVRLDPLAVVEFGVLLMLFTPIARIVVAVVCFFLPLGF